MKRSAAAVAGTGLPSLNYADISAAIEKRLFIGKVPPGTSEDEILSVFGNHGVIKECRVVPDRSGSSNGIAFVSYDTWASAHRALLESDGRQQLSGHEGTPSTLVVSFAERTSNVGRGGGLAYAKGLDINRVFVGSLPVDATEDELRVRFSAVGVVEGASLLAAKSRLRCGYVNFEVWGEALDAVEKLHGQPLRTGAEPMTVVLAQPKDKELASGAGAAAMPRASAAAVAVSEPPAKYRRTDLTSLLTGLTAAASSPDLLGQLLNTYVTAVTNGSPTSACDLIHDQVMKTRERLHSAASSVPHTVPPRGAGDRGAADVDKERLFVGGLPHDIADEDLASLAGQLTFPGMRPESYKLLECRVLPGKGCGYLRYATWEAAEEAYAALHGRQVEGWTQVLRVQWASPRPAGRGHHAQGAPQPEFSAAAAAGVIPSPGPPDPLTTASQAEVEAQGLDPTRLFIGQIARDVDAGGILRPLFEEHGHLIEFRWVQEKGVLYASFSSFAEARSALQALGNSTVPGVSKGLNVKFSQKPRWAAEGRR